MSKETTRWYSERLQREVHVARWGVTGAPLLLFPTAAGDAGEVERFHLVGALGGLLAEGRVKVYSVDSVAGMAWLDESLPAGEAARVQNRYDAFVYHELVPAIRADCRSADVEIVAAGASIGAFNALASVCRHPDAFSKAICMSGTYDLTRFLRGAWNDDFYYSSPLHFVPDLHEGPHLQALRKRFVLLAHGQGRWEDPSQSWRVADLLGKRGVPNRVDAWSGDHDHDWPTWRKMLPQYLSELL